MLETDYCLIKKNKNAVSLVGMKTFKPQANETLEKLVL